MLFCPFKKMARKADFTSKNKKATRIEYFEPYALWLLFWLRIKNPKE